MIAHGYRGDPVIIIADNHMSNIAFFKHFIRFQRAAEHIYCSGCLPFEFAAKKLHLTELLS